MSSDDRRPDGPSWCGDGRRSRLAAGVALGVTVVALGAFALVGPPGDDWTASMAGLAVIAFNLYAAVYVAVTWSTFAPCDDVGFTARLGERGRVRRRRMRRALPGGDGPSFAISAALMAFSIVLVVPHIPAIRLDDWLLVPASVVTLLSCWGMSVVGYALHYAQHDLAEPALAFPGERTGAFEDYVYFAVGVAATLGATDVNITRPAMRRIVTVNVVIAFLFNSVVVALLASILVR